MDTGPICWKADRSRRFLVEVQPQSLVWVVLGPASLGSAEPQSFDRFLAFGPPEPDVPADVVARLTGIIESRPDAETWRQRAQDLLATWQQDPEDRIRSLEQRLADRSGGDYAERSPGPGERAGWIVLAVLVVGLIISGGVILAQWAGRPVAGPPGGMTAERTPPSPPPAASPGSASPQPRVIAVTGVGTTRTLACDGSAASISGAGNTVMLTGECSRLEVSGVENTVTVDAARAIVVSGVGNRVLFRSGQPTVETSGTGNSVEPG